MVSDVDLKRKLDLTGVVAGNELTSLQRLDRRILRRTAEVSEFLFSQLRKLGDSSDPDIHIHHPHIHIHRGVHCVLAHRLFLL